MTKNANGISLKKSNRFQELNGVKIPNLPSADKLVEGELAINYAEGLETISTKNESGTVVTFSSDDYYTAKKLGSGFTGVNSARTVTDAIVNADWDEEDETSGAFIKNKPFGETCEYEVGFEGVLTVPSDSPVPDRGSLNFEPSNVARLSLGDTYRVTIDGVVYEEVAEKVLGVTNHIGLHFYEGQSTPYNDTWCLFDSTSTNYILNIYGANPGDSFNVKYEKLVCTTKTIDNKYLDTIWESGTGDGSATRKGLHSNAVGQYSVAEAAYCNAVGVGSHCESQYGTASGNSSHAEGFATTAYAQYSHTEGYTTNANGSAAHAEGQSTHAIGNYSHSEGSNTTAFGESSHAEGKGTTAYTDYSHTEGNYTMASGDSSHAEGRNTSTYGANSHTEGYGTTASGSSSHAEGLNTSTYGENSHAEGRNTSTYGANSHAEGNYTIASGSSSHAEGSNTKASGSSSHAEGNYTIASGSSSHAEGYNTSTYGEESHAEGSYTTASGTSSHAEGSDTKAYGNSSHVEGNNTKAYGNASHAEGIQTIAYNDNEHASGRFNVSSSASTEFGSSGNTLFSVGNGTADNARHNAFEIRQNGDIYIINKDGNDVKLQDEIGNIDVDQDFSNTASTNPISTKAVYSAVTDNELVWTNAFVALSGTVSAHTANTEIHVTAADKTAWNGAVTDSHTHSNKSALDAITGSVGTMAYENANSYSSATQVNTALGGKADTGHTHEASGVTAMTGYVKAASGTPITTADTLNEAIGKLEKMIEEFKDYIEQKELAIAAAITDLDNRLKAIE